MANYVKVSTIGCTYSNVNLNSSMETAVVEMAESLRQKISRVLPDRPDLIVVPEECDLPANYPREQRLPFFKVRGDYILNMFCEIAKENKCYLTYPRFKEMEDGTWRNTIEFIDRSGKVIGAYHKNHLVIFEIEDGGLCGKSAAVLETDFGTVGFALCFDLNFDKLRLQYVKAKPDLILFGSMYHGGLMQNYWAYSCRSYLVSAISNSKPSQIISPVGHAIRTNTNYFDYFTETINLDYLVCHLDGHWEKLDRMKAKYGSKANFFDPGNLASVLITSDCDEFTAEDLKKEFEFEELDDFLERSLACQSDPNHIER